MKYFVALISDQNGKPVGTATIAHDARAASVAVAPVPFVSDAAAAAYRQQLAAHYDLPTTTARRDNGAPAGGKRQRVKHMTTGEIFPSAAAAARSIGCSTTMLVRHLRHPFTTRDIRGNRFVHIDHDGREIIVQP